MNTTTIWVQDSENGWVQRPVVPVSAGYKDAENGIVYYHWLGRAISVTRPPSRHQRAIEADCQILLRHTRDYAAAMSRGAYFPLDDADFSASGCLDAPEWIPAGCCGMWDHNTNHVGMIVLNREDPL